MPVELQPGDVYCSRGGIPLVSAGIRLVQWLHSKDNQVHYGHSGIITSAEGEVLETGWRVRIGHMDEYLGDRVLIARPLTTLGTNTEISTLDKLLAIRALKRDCLGRWYPVWRLPMHIAPAVAKYLGSGKNLVCSERTAKYLRLIGARPWPEKGVNPDMLADEWATWRNFDVLYEGLWPPLH